MNTKTLRGHLSRFSTVNSHVSHLQFSFRTFPKYDFNFEAKSFLGGGSFYFKPFSFYKYYQNDLVRLAGLSLEDLLYFKPFSHQNLKTCEKPVSHFQFFLRTCPKYAAWTLKHSNFWVESLFSLKTWRWVNNQFHIYSCS